MILNISNHESTVIESGVYYFALSDYPNITTSELKGMVEFIKYEKSTYTTFHSTNLVEYRSTLHVIYPCVQLHCEK